MRRRFFTIFACVAVIGAASEASAGQTAAQAQIEPTVLPKTAASKFFGLYSLISFIADEFRLITSTSQASQPVTGSGLALDGAAGPSNRPDRPLNPSTAAQTEAIQQMDQPVVGIGTISGADSGPSIASVTPVGSSGATDGAPASGSMTISIPP